MPEDFEVLVFADSDGRPGHSWLRRLTAPLTDSRIGAATTMRWLIPNNNDFPSVLLAAWNAPIVTMLGRRYFEKFLLGRRHCDSAERSSNSPESWTNGNIPSAMTIP